jgi:hypothetical protein
MARLRARRREHREVITVAIPEWIVEDLVECGRLSQFDRDDPAKKAAAVERLVIDQVTLSPLVRRTSG